MRWLRRSDWWLVAGCVVLVAASWRWEDWHRPPPPPKPNFPPVTNQTDKWPGVDMGYMPQHYTPRHLPSRMGASMEQTILYLLIPCSASGCGNPWEECPACNSRWFKSLKDCESMLADWQPGVFFPPDSRGRYHFTVKNASGKEVLSDKWWECQHK
jgi:hypothetical protein